MCYICMMYSAFWLMLITKKTCLHGRAHVAAVLAGTDVNTLQLYTLWKLETRSLNNSH